MMIKNNRLHSSQSGTGDPGYSKLANAEL